MQKGSNFRIEISVYAEFLSLTLVLMLVVLESRAQRGVPVGAILGNFLSLVHNGLQCVVFDLLDISCMLDVGICTSPVSVGAI